MKLENPFDKKMEINKGLSAPMRHALDDTVDTLDICWAGARAVFEDKATPEHALAILTLVLQRERQLHADLHSPDNESDRP